MLIDTLIQKLNFNQKKILPVALGNIPAYRIEVKTIDPLLYLNIINVLRINSIIALPASEGTEIAGFLENKEQLDILKKYGKLAIGAPTEKTQSYLYFDGKNELGIIGCTAIIAAYRGNYLNKEYTSYQITNRNVKKIIGKKNTEIVKINEKQIFKNIDKYTLNNQVSKEVFYPIRRYEDLKTMKKHFLTSGQIIKIDANNFSKSLLATPDGLMKTFLSAYISFFNNIEERILKIDKNILVSERTTDSVEFYIKNSNVLNKISKILNQLQEKEGLIKIKAVNHTIKNTTLTTLNGRVFHSNKPISKEVWRRKEQKIKDFQNSFPNKKTSVALWNI